MKVKFTKCPPGDVTGTETPEWLQEILDTWRLGCIGEGGYTQGIVGDSYCDNLLSESCEVEDEENIE
ncbi:MAG: hypothetical protein ACXACF_01640 [Candidatus Hermodarchaeia archaeon]|jgi:hypothetical protein